MPKYQNLQSPDYKTKEARDKRIKDLLKQLFDTENDKFEIHYTDNSSEILSSRDEVDIAVAFDSILDKYYSGQELSIKISLHRVSSNEQMAKKVDYIRKLIKSAIIKINTDRKAKSSIENNDNATNNNQIINRNNHTEQTITANNRHPISNDNQIIARNNTEQTITSNRNNELPLIFDYRPEFHQPNDSSIVQQLSPVYSEINVYHEVNEVIWLRAIQRLTAEDVGLPNNKPALLAKFKATMILQAHELFFDREKWHRKFTTLLSSMFKDIRTEICTNAITNNPRGVGQAELKITLVLTMFSTLFLPIDTGLSNIEKLVRDALDKLKHGRFIEENLGDLMVRWETHIQEIFNQLTRALYAETFKISIQQQSKAFDFTELKSALESKKTYNIDSLHQQKWLKESQTQQIIQLRQEYIAFYERFLGNCQDTVSHAQRLAPDFTEELYSQCYQQAFKTLQKNPKRYVDDFLIEMALQQQRKPRYSPILYDQLVNIVLPVANFFYKTKQLAEKTFSDISIELKSLTILPASLEELVASAYAILHTPLNSLNNILTNNASILIGWIDLPSNTNSNNTSALAIMPNNTQELVSTLEHTAPLFDRNSPIPGAITHAQVIILAEQFDHTSKYQSLFTGFRSLPNMINATDTVDRNNAVNVFNDTLNETTKIEEIMALLTVAKEYINRHRNPLTDWMRNKQNTEIWKTCFKSARLRALSLLPTEAPTVTQLNSYRPQFIFSGHREESYLLGAWGNTSAQRDIDRMIGNLKK